MQYLLSLLYYKLIFATIFLIVARGSQPSPDPRGLRAQSKSEARARLSVLGLQSAADRVLLGAGTINKARGYDRSRPKRRGRRAAVIYIRLN